MIEGLSEIVELNKITYEKARELEEKFEKESVGKRKK